MHVRLVSLLAVLVAACAPAAHADTPVDVRMLSCVPWEEPTGGVVVYAAEMDAIPGTARMAIRFRLFEKAGDGRFERVSAEKLGVWRRSQVGATSFRYKQRVRGLRQGAIYRAVVHYRWFGSDGAAIQTARRVSPICSQPGGLPNLRVAEIDVRRGEVEETAVYKVQIVNRGVATAHNVGVLLRVDGEIVDEAEVIDVLEPNEVRTVTFNGPVCRRRLRVVVDPKELISESRERDNVEDPSCL